MSPSSSHRRRPFPAFGHDAVANHSPAVEEHTERMDATTLRSVELSRTAPGTFRAVNVRGGTLDIVSDGSPTFTPVELLLAAIGACSGMDVEAITGKRAAPDEFAMTVAGDKIRDESGNRLVNLSLTFRVAFPEGVGGDAARVVLPDAVRMSHDRLCTVSRTVEVGSPIATSVE
jgi:putative redox protein